MKGHIRKRGKSSWELVVDMGRHALLLSHLPGNGSDAASSRKKEKRQRSTKGNNSG